MSNLLPPDGYMGEEATELISRQIITVNSGATNSDLRNISAGVISNKDKTKTNSDV